MRKKAVFLLIFVLLAECLCMGASAESYKPNKNWYVRYTGTALEDNFTSGDITDAIGNLQSGDDTTIVVELRNDTPNEKVTFYMRNKVLETLEETRKNIEGGAYSYYLTYQAPNGTTTELFSSDRVGGLDTNGLSSATNSLKDYFRLGEIPAGGRGYVTLKVVMEGESTVNSYQSTFAKLDMQFAIEKTGGDPYIPSTGERGTIMLWAALMLLCLVIVIVTIRMLLKNTRNNTKKKGAGKK